MVNSFDTVASYADRHSVNMRIAAYMLAIDRVALQSESAEFTHRASEKKAI